jgi:NADPH-dependent ferric siderophore reductase
MDTPQTQKLRRPRQKPRLAEVVRVEQLTPHMVRIVFGGEEFEGFAMRGPAAHLKVNLPSVGESKLVLPEWGPDGPTLLDGR